LSAEWRFTGEAAIDVEAWPPLWRLMGTPPTHPNFLGAEGKALVRLD
jgi:hypothetical protein